MSYKKWHETNEEDSFDTVTKDGKVYDIGIMLHGECDLFAVRLGRFLKEKKIPFKYGILSNEDDGLIHSFLYVCDDKIQNGANLLIDVRGITNNFKDFFDEFEDFFSYSAWIDGYDDSSITHYKTERWFKKAISKLCYEDLNWYFEQEEENGNADAIINAFQEYYIPS